MDTTADMKKHLHKNKYQIHIKYNLQLKSMLSKEKCIDSSFAFIDNILRDRKSSN